METLKIMIVGVGGQGTLLSSKLLGRLLLENGYDVKVSEVHGMSQRGGSVVTYVCAGDRAFSPIIDEGEADYIISFELLEAARYVPYLKKGGTIVTNTAAIDPMPVITGAQEYPEHIIEKLENSGINVVTLDALALALKAGSAKAVNIVLLGRFLKLLHLEGADWETAIRESVPERFIQLNLEAFRLGAE